MDSEKGTTKKFHRSNVNRDRIEKIENKIKNPAPFIEGKRISLVPLNSEHIKHYIYWANNLKIRRLARNSFPYTIEKLKKFNDANSQEVSSPSEINFEIWHKIDKIPIGSCGIMDIIWPNKSCWLYLSIGHEEYWNERYGTETAVILIKYVFEELGLHRISINIYEDNHGSFGIAKHLGLIKEGVQKDILFLDGRFYDGHLFRILDYEWANMKEDLENKFIK